MPDMYAPVATQIKPPDSSQAINTMTGILGLQQQRQALQTGQYQQQSAQANAQMTQQDAQNRAAAGSFFKNFDIAKHHGDDGTLDLDSALTSDEFKATGDSAPEIAKSLLSIKNSQLAAKTSLAGLNGTLRDQFSSQVAGLAQDADVKSGNQTGRGKVLDAIDQFGQTSPDAKRVAGIYSQVLQNTPPEKMGQALQNLQLQARSAGEQLPTPTTVDTGAQIQPGSVAPGTGAITPAGPPINKGIAPGAQVLTDSFGRQFRFNPQTNQVEPIGTGPAQNSPGQPQRTPFTQPVAGQGQVQQDIDTARKAGDSGGQIRGINDKLLSLSEQTRTGPGAQSVQKIAAAVGLPSGSNYQEINAYLERQAATAGQAMGLPNTNAGLHAAQQASGTAEYTPQALQEKVKFADALNSGVMAYRQGLDKLVGTGATPDYSKYQAFRSAWAQNFSPDVFRAEDALRRGDKKELADIKSELGSRGMADMKKRADNLRMLENGQLPQ